MRVCKSAYYHWLKIIKTPKRTQKSVLQQRIKEVFDENKQVYGSHRIQKVLEKEGKKYARSYIARLMQEMGLKSVLRRKFVVTTDSSHHYKTYRNVLARNFSSKKLGQKWVSDITYIRVKDDWCYLTTMIDLADRKVVGWSLSEDMTVENTIVKAWLSARNTRSITKDFTFHSDRGVQYASEKIRNLFQLNKYITQSMSRKGNCWDNAVAESFFKTIKHECLNRYKFLSYEELYNCIAEYINWYNTKRLHSSIGYKAPIEKEIELRMLTEKYQEVA